MSSREDFLARIRQATVQGRHYRVQLRDVPNNVAYLGEAGDLCERFATEVNAVGGQAFVAADLAAARVTFGDLLQESGASSAVCWKHDLLDRLGLPESLAAAGVAVYDYDRLMALDECERRSALLACDVGITSCDYAIAETGTLMMFARPGQERVASLLPPMHIAIVERQQIVPDLVDAFAILQKSSVASMPSNVTFITGPSKTGDIELQLTTGVHGPGKWRVIVIQ